MPNPTAGVVVVVVVVGVLVTSWAGTPTALGRPSSSSGALGSDFRLIKMFSGFTSRCTTACKCKKAKAAVTSLATLHTSDSGIIPSFPSADNRCSQFSSDPPSHNSIWMCNDRSCCQAR